MYSKTRHVAFHFISAPEAFSQVKRYLLFLSARGHLGEVI